MEKQRVRGCIESQHSLRPTKFLLSQISIITVHRGLSVVVTNTEVTTSCTVLSPGSSQKVGLGRLCYLGLNPDLTPIVPPWLLRTQQAPGCCSAVRQVYEPMCPGSHCLSPNSMKVCPARAQASHKMAVTKIKTLALPPLPFPRHHSVSFPVWTSFELVSLYRGC